MNQCALVMSLNKTNIKKVTIFRHPIAFLFSYWRVVKHSFIRLYIQDFFLYWGGSGNCGHLSHSVHMLLYNHIVVGKYVHMIDEINLLLFVSLNTKAKYWLMFFQCRKINKIRDIFMGEMRTVVGEMRTTCFYCKHLITQYVSLLV